MNNQSLAQEAMEVQEFWRSWALVCTPDMVRTAMNDPYYDQYMQELEEIRQYRYGLAYREQMLSCDWSFLDAPTGQGRTGQSDDIGYSESAYPFLW